MRRRLERLRTLDRGQRQALLGAVPLLVLTTVALRFAGFKRTARVLGAYSRRAPVVAVPDDARALAEVVAIVAGQSLIGARCLARSLVLWFLLRRRGIDADLVIGAAPPAGGPLAAHAWVEVDGVPVNDLPDVRARYGSFGLRLPRLADEAT